MTGLLQSPRCPSSALNRESLLPSGREALRQGLGRATEGLSVADGAAAPARVKPGWEKLTAGARREASPELGPLRQRVEGAARGRSDAKWPAGNPRGASSARASSGSSGATKLGCLEAFRRNGRWGVPFPQAQAVAPAKN